MKRWLLAGLFLPAMCLVLSEVRGDVAGPRRPGGPVVPPVRPIIPPGGGGALPNPVKVKLVVKVDEKAKHAILEVPINLAMGQLRDGNLGLAPEADPEGGRRFGLATVVAGLSLTMAFASGGLWLARRGKKRILATLLVASICTVGMTAVWGNLGPRPVGRPRPPDKESLSTLKLPAGLEIGESMILKPVAPANYLTLIVPKSMVLEREKDGKDKETTPRDKRTR
jgi:hypothetical protein